MAGSTGLVQTVVFDLGGVLVDWNPRYLYRKIFLGDEAKVSWFLDNVCTFEWNEKQDAGRPIAMANAEAIQKFPQYKDEINAYYSRFREMLSGPIEGTVEILMRLHGNKVPLYALTNWSAELFPMARKLFPFFSVFRDILISGEVGLKKPDPQIFQLLIDRFQLQPQQAVYIDDRLDNCQAASLLGFRAHHFTDPSRLMSDLRAHGLLT